MPASNIATAADYADAMMIARRAKNWIFLLLLLMLLIQLAVFFVARQTNLIIRTPESLSETLTTQPATTQPAWKSDVLPKVLQYVTVGIDFLGVALVIVMTLVLLLIVNIMLVGRLIGVAQVTSAFIWCVLLAVLLFPWQSFLQDSDFKGDFKIPGVLYTWSELTHPTQGAKFDKIDRMKLDAALLRWARFVGFPALSVLLLLTIQAKSSRGLRAALGESELESTGEMAIS